jgi:hypothetical protein
MPSVRVSERAVRVPAQALADRSAGWDAVVTGRIGLVELARVAKMIGRDVQWVRRC